jgi:hypothetical protein
MLSRTQQRALLAAAALIPIGAGLAVPSAAHADTGICTGLRDGAMVEDLAGGRPVVCGQPDTAVAQQVKPRAERRRRVCGTWWADRAHTRVTWACRYATAAEARGER